MEIKPSVNCGRKFASFLLSKKLQDDSLRQNESRNWPIIRPRPIDKDGFLQTLRVWFYQLARKGHTNEMFHCMEAALDVFNELDTEILSYTANILLILDHVYQANKIYRIALESARNCFDILEDFEETCNRCVERWHFRMLNDHARNRAYFQAVRKAVQDGYNDVIDIGSGTSILSLFAASGGASNILACETSNAMFALSQEVIIEAKYQTQIRTVNKMSNDLVNGDDFDKRFSLLVTEIFDCGLFGEGAIPTLKHALKSLLINKENEALERKPKVIPSGARVYATLIESLGLRKHSRCRSSVLGLRLGSINVVGRRDPGDVTEQPYTTENLKYIKGGFKMLSLPVCIMDIDFNECAELDKLTQTFSLVDIPVIEQGCVDAIAVWFELQLDETTMISSSPEAESCWEQAIYHLENEDDQILDSVYLPRGAAVKLKCFCNEQYLQIFVNEISKDPGEPYCLTEEQDNTHDEKSVSKTPILINSRNNYQPLQYSASSVVPNNGIVSPDNTLQTRTPTYTNCREYGLPETNSVASLENGIVSTDDDIQTSSTGSTGPNVDQLEMCPNSNKLDSNDSKTQISADRRVVARLNDADYLQAYKSAISLAIRTIEMSNGIGGIDVLCMCGKMSLIPLVIQPRGNIRIQVLCDDDTRMFHEIIAKENDIDLRYYQFCPLSLLDVAETGKKFDVVVMEAVEENGLISQRLFDDVVLIRNFLLNKNGILLPEGFSLNGILISSNMIERENFVDGTDNTMGFDIGRFINEYRVFTHPDIELLTLPCVHLSEEFTIMHVSFVEGSSEGDIKKLSLPKDATKTIHIKDDGNLSGVGYWFKIFFRGNIQINSAPNENTHWHQAVTLCKKQIAVHQNEKVRINFLLNRCSLHIVDFGK